MNDQKTATADHAYSAPLPRDSRSPCPALNSLANHGYLPRDGYNIGCWTLACSLVKVYNLSYPLALFLSTVGVIFCGHPTKLPWTLSLHNLCLHHRIEHNVSTAHADAKPGEEFAPSRPDKVLLRHLLGYTQADGNLTLNGFVRARIRRALEERKPLDWVHREIAHGESALTLLVLGQGKPQVKDSALAIPRKFVEQWYGDEKLPEGWNPPVKQVGLLRAVWLSKTVAIRILQQDYIAKSA
ncbi:uncharacterized protein PHACADRAFT_249438 [Phanerochaete carnosa HHB-10118-sp]|uniref:Heme haloperoxidase family profile domain-containing protein n=1 Tax=Phanerochaete carnosa (strain HHB-10118-sp) TaxID=650164 RepID=K5WIG9_PHACS|nr:uncharacterized protein PHACADRAFT_249438 [Phanerochaete carnosa HHB-10118-sp]EKM59175.1 hypothetical protein PHACADRAFT_249438 [Phanerochaete carnosa HHB-10118-sp]